MNRSFSKDGIFCPLTRFRWLPLSSKFRWRKWVSPQKVNINGDLLESEKEDVSSQDSSQCESTWPTGYEVAASEAALRGTLGWRQYSEPLTLLPSAGWLDHCTTLTHPVHVISPSIGNIPTSEGDCKHAQDIHELMWKQVPPFSVGENYF